MAVEEKVEAFILAIRCPHKGDKTGPEIEAVFLEAMFAAFERGNEPTEMDVAASMSSFVPLSKLMAEQIAALKQWANNRARPSTSTPEPPERKLRKLGV